VQDRLLQFIQSADTDSFGAEKGHLSDAKADIDLSRSALVEYQAPEDLRAALQLQLPISGEGQSGLIRILEKILRYSVNTWHQGFLDKLYASTNAPGVAAELILATLNTNVHVYQVSPALSVIEKHVSRQLASFFGLEGSYAGGISVPGGSASNISSIVIARNNLFPNTKADGYGTNKFVLFTSTHGHYSIQQAAQMLGFGSKAVWSVPVDGQGRMVPSALGKLAERAKNEGKSPFYVNATAGTTVLGSFDPFAEIGAICRKHKLWFHIDGSWGGSFIFSQSLRAKLSGADQADSIAINPHKMLGVPVTCSFLLGADIRQFHRANTLPAGYLFHSNYPETLVNGQDTSTSNLGSDSPEVWDLADLTLQCGRRADSLKLFLSWTYYGSEGYERQINSAYDVAAYLATIIAQSQNLILVSENPPPCLQVCFRYGPGKQLVFPPSRQISGRQLDDVERGKRNSKITEEIARGLVNKGFMIDFAPPSGEEVAGQGKFFRCVVNVLTKRETVDTLVDAVLEVGAGVVAQQRGVVKNISPIARPSLGQALGKNPAEQGYEPVAHYY
jgi:glutamate decarboxylase